MTTLDTLHSAGKERYIAIGQRISRLLSHLFQHQIHHCGQAHAMLAGTAVEPPQLDEFFCANEADLRAADFRELGFSEAGIWSVE